MNKREKLELEKNIDNEEYIEEHINLITKKLIFNPLIRLVFLVILLVVSFINHKRIVKLALLTSNAIFSSDTLLGHVTYYFIIIFAILFCVFFSLSAYFMKPKINLKDGKTLKKIYNIYSFYDMFVFIVSTFVYLYFIIMVLITPCNISGSSMENTYKNGDRVFLWNLGYNPKNGDVIVFDSYKYTYRGEDSRFFIKRIVATEGDKLILDDGELYINDVLIQVLSKDKHAHLYNILEENNFEYIVPKDKILVFGDNRDGSYDSRHFGFIDESEIVGKVIFRFYPFNKLGNPQPDLK